MTAPVVRVSGDPISVFLQHLRHIELFTLRRLDNDAVEILLIARRTWVIEHGPRKLTVLLGNEAGQNTIVPIGH